jgi:hypothetical protein
MSQVAPSSARTEEPMLWFNGIDGRRGSYLTPPVPPRQLADLACGATLEPARARELQAWVARGEGKARRGLKEGLDPAKLEEAGWGVIFPRSADAGPLREALAPLLDLRRAQAGKCQERFYREFIGDDGYCEGESKVAFLARHNAGPGPADPDKVPYYLLLVGDPEAIPFSFQYQLDVQYAVGRLCFDQLEDYCRYAESVVAAEAGGSGRRPRACFFAPANQGDPVTASTRAHLVQPVAAGVERDQPGWSVETVLGEEATRGRLGSLLDEAPAFLFAACHGLGFAAGDPEQRDRQGALVCQDWPGPGPGGIDRDHYFAAEDVGEQARVHGLVAFCFACFGAGTPRWDEFTRKSQGPRRELSPGAFLGRLPQRLLGHPKGGALAVVGPWTAPGASLWCGPMPVRRSPPSRAPSVACSTGSRWAGRWNFSISGTPSSPPIWRRRWRLWDSASSSTRSGSPISGLPATMPATTRSSAIPRCGSPATPEEVQRES